MMNLTEGFLIFIILLVIVLIYTRGKKCIAKHVKPAPTKPASSTTEKLTTIEPDNKQHDASEISHDEGDYSEWIASQAVDRQVIKNHSDFVKDRLTNDTQNTIGRTYSPDSHMSYDPTPWLGLRRPQAVKVDNPTQVVDVDYDLYSKKPTFTWTSS